MTGGDRPERMVVSAEALAAIQTILQREAAPYRYHRGHRLCFVRRRCVDCGMPEDAMVEATNNDAGDRCAQERVLRGRSAIEARQLGDHELCLLMIDGVQYQEHKIYRGALCVGTRYHVAEVAD